MADTEKLKAQAKAAAPKEALAGPIEQIMSGHRRTGEGLLLWPTGSRTVMDLGLKFFASSAAESTASSLADKTVVRQLPGVAGVVLKNGTFRLEPQGVQGLKAA